MNAESCSITPSSCHFTEISLKSRKQTDAGDTIVSARNDNLFYRYHKYLTEFARRHGSCDSVSVGAIAACGLIAKQVEGANI